MIPREPSTLAPYEDQDPLTQFVQSGAAETGVSTFTDLRVSPIESGAPQARRREESLGVERVHPGSRQRARQTPWQALVPRRQGD